MNKIISNIILPISNGRTHFNLESSILSRLTFLTLIILVSVYFPKSFANEDAIEAYEQKNFSEAKALFERSLKSDPKSVISLQYLAKIAIKDSEFDDAEDFILRAQEIAPKNASVQYDVAQIMGRQAQESSIFSAPGYAKKTLKAYEQAVQLEPSNINYRQGLIAFYLQAPSIVGGDKELALEQAIAIETLDPVKGFIALVDVYQTTEENTKLETLYSTIDSKFPESGGLFYRRGLYYQSAKKYSKALVDFQKAHAAKPQNEDDLTAYAALYQIGRNSVLSGKDIDNGIKALQDYLVNAPSDPILPGADWTKYRLGLLLSNKGDKQNAAKLFKQAKSETKDKRLLKLLKKK